MRIRRLTTILLLSFLAISFNSCAVINSLLGIESICEYPGCYNETSGGAKYCFTHSGTGEVPADLEKKADKSINKSLEKYRKNQGKTFKKSNYYSK